MHLGQRLSRSVDSVGLCPNIPILKTPQIVCSYECEMEYKGLMRVCHTIGKRVMSWHCNACLYIVNQDLCDVTLEYKIITRSLQGHCKVVLRLWELKIGSNAMSWHHPFANDVEVSSSSNTCDVVDNLWQPEHWAVITRLIPHHHVLVHSI